MTLGKYRHSVTIQKPTGTLDAAGHLELDEDAQWATHATPKVEIKPALGSETGFGRLIEAGITHIVSMHYSTLSAAIVPRMRVLFGTRKLNIEAVISVDELSREVRLGCREVQ